MIFSVYANLFFNLGDFAKLNTCKN